MSLARYTSPLPQAPNLPVSFGFRAERIVNDTFIYAVRAAFNAGHVWMAQRVFEDDFTGNLAFDADGNGISESLSITDAKDPDLDRFLNRGDGKLPLWRAGQGFCNSFSSFQRRGQPRTRVV